VDEAKPFDIPKREVWEAFKKVKANQGAAPIAAGLCGKFVSGPVYLDGGLATGILSDVDAASQFE
jgi:hypothetical protein